MSDQPTAADIKVLLQANVASLAAELAPDGKRSGAYWIARNPTRADKNAGSFYIWISGGAPGAWRDDATGDKGDVFDLIAYVEGLDKPKHDMRPVLNWSRAWLGLDGAAKPKLRERIQAATDAQAARDAQSAAELEKARRTAKAIYLESRQLPFYCSPADTYLRGRGIDVSLLSKLPGCIGWVPECWHSETQTKWPALVACFTADDGSVAAVHRTFVARDGKRKAPVSPARKIWPSFSGAAIHLWRGASGLPVRAAAANGLLETLVICEGVEDALSLALACPELRIWAAGSLANIGNLKIPACCDRVIVTADNDWGKPQAQALLARAIDAIAAQGKDVSIARSSFGKDVNDALVSG